MKSYVGTEGRNVPLIDGAVGEPGKTPRERVLILGAQLVSKHLGLAGSASVVEGSPCSEAGSRKETCVLRDLIQNLKTEPLSGFKQQKTSWYMEADFPRSLKKYCCLENSDEWSIYLTRASWTSGCPGDSGGQPTLRIWFQNHLESDTVMCKSQVSMLSFVTIHTQSLWTLFLICYLELIIST